jgi:ubiquinone/menaquinone biosynthesis C-methylase UbiE
MHKPEEYDAIDFDSDEAIELAAKALKEKKCLYDIYRETYLKMMKLKEKHLNAGENILEIGSGGGFIKDLYPYVITSDVKKTASDMIVNAEELPFEDNSLDAIFAQHVLHHIPDINKFFREALRVVKPGGGIVCVETYWSPVAKYLFKKIHPEPFDEKAASWTLSENKGPLTGSNQALSYILLKRDQKLFQQLYPQIDCVCDYPFGFMRYILTGGLWLKPKVPEFVFPILKGMEFVLRPLMPLLAIHHVFVLKIND